MKKFTVIAAAAVISLGLTACGSVNNNPSSSGSGSGTAKDVKSITIGFAQRTADAPYYVAMQKRAEQLAKEKGFKLLFQSANGDPVSQIDQVNTMLSQGVDALIVNAVSADTEKTQMTTAAGRAPLLFIDTPIPDVGFTTVQSDNATIGKDAGALMAERIGAGKTVKVAILNGGPTDLEVGPARRKGFLAGLESKGVKYQIVAEATASYAQDKAVPATEDMLSANPDIDVIFGYNDAMALGALSVLKSKANTKALVAGVDGQKEALKAITDGGCTGQYVSTGLNSPSLAAEQAVDIAIKVATGQAAKDSFGKVNYTKATGINCNNVKEFYDANSVF